MNRAISAIVKKDMREITANRQLLLTIVVVPLVLTLVMPTIYFLTAHFAPEEVEELQQLMRLLPAEAQAVGAEALMAKLLLDNILPMFFLIIPIMAASVMAASSFVGEKEQSTLETLLYCPLTVKQLFYAKVLASFLMSMLVSWSSFLVMVLVLGLEFYVLTGGMMTLGVSWVLVMVCLSPAVSLIAITLIVRRSAKAQNVMEAQQKAAFLVLPVVFLIAGQFIGAMLINAWILAGLSLGLGVLAWVLLRMSLNKFCGEMLLAGRGPGILIKSVKPLKDHSKGFTLLIFNVDC